MEFILQIPLQIFALWSCLFSIDNYVVNLDLYIIHVQ